jgi:hypothetical protein
LRGARGMYKKPLTIVDKYF